MAACIMKTRKHIPQTEYQGYTVPFPLFTPLTPEECETVERGAEPFRQQYPETLLFPDPFLLPVRKSAGGQVQDLRIVCGEDAFYCELAGKLAAAFRQTYGVNVAVVSSDEPEAALDAPHPRLYFGGAESNRRSLELARRYQVGVFCSAYPGAGGWGVTTYWELEAGFAPCYVLACDSESGEDALQQVVEGIASREGALRWIHTISPGKDAPAWLQEFDFDQWILKFKTPPTTPLDLLDEWLETGRKRPYREVFTEFFTRRYDKALPYNAAFLDVGLQGVRCYQMTGSEQALDLFRETLWGFWNYLNTDDPQIYISDMDFRVGNLCNYWQWIQHHPSFGDEERFVFDRLFLGVFRMIRDYYCALWTQRPKPFNHQTFKARSLICGWRYFRQRNVPDVGSWKEEADRLFDSVDFQRHKFLENSNGYEAFVPEHTLVWLEVTGQPVAKEWSQSLAEFSLRSWAMRDNFLSPVDYGDVDPELTVVRPPLEVAPWLDGSTPEQRKAMALEAAGNRIFPLLEVLPVHGFSGLRIGKRGQELPPEFGWIRCAMDPGFASQAALAGDAREQFDKLVWRSGWALESAYVALEGLGTGNKQMSHAHHETNGILRMNLGGRIWLVRSGYGKKPNGEIDAGRIFVSRQVGPEEHNMLVVREGEALVIPPANALLKELEVAPLPYALSEVENYGGVKWRRHIVLLGEVGMVVADQVICGNPVPVELQWNALGKPSLHASGATLEQNGVELEWEQFGTSVAEWRESEIYIWRRLIERGEYPHTTHMPVHCIQRPVSDGGEVWFLNGFWLKGAVQQASWNGETKTLLLAPSGGWATEGEHQLRSEGEIVVRKGEIQIRF